MIPESTITVRLPLLGRGGQILQPRANSGCLVTSTATYSRESVGRAECLPESSGPAGVGVARFGPEFSPTIESAWVVLTPERIVGVAQDQARRPEHCDRPNRSTGFIRATSADHRGPDPVRTALHPGGRRRRTQATAVCPRSGDRRARPHTSWMTSCGSTETPQTTCRTRSKDSPADSDR